MELLTERKVKNMKMKNLLIAAVAGALLLSGCSAGGGKTAVKVGDSAISENGVKFVAEYLMNTGKAENAADILRDDFLLKEIADKMNLEVSEDDEASAKQMIAQFKSSNGGKKAGDKILSKFGLDDDFLMTIALAETYSNLIMENIDVAEPTDDEVYQSFKDKYMRAKHVLIPTTDDTTGADLDEEGMKKAEETANEVLEKAKGGANFDDLVKEYGKDPGMESNKDGYIFTDNEMVSEFEDAVKSIKPGEFTICKSNFGYHIIQRLELKEGDELFKTYFDENKSMIKSRLEANKQEEAIDSKAEELGIKTEENEEVINGITIEDVSSLG